jgi:hypothetical protein
MNSGHSLRALVVLVLVMLFCISGIAGEGQHQNKSI